MKGKLLEGREEFEQLCARLCRDRGRAAEINGVFLAEIDNYRELGSRYGMEGQDRMVTNLPAWCTSAAPCPVASMAFVRVKQLLMSCV